MELQWYNYFARIINTKLNCIHTFQQEPSISWCLVFYDHAFGYYINQNGFLVHMFEYGVDFLTAINYNKTIINDSQKESR